MGEWETTISYIQSDESLGEKTHKEKGGLGCIRTGKVKRQRLECRVWKNAAELADAF